jgi:hypothetical protein
VQPNSCESGACELEFPSLSPLLIASSWRQLPNGQIEFTMSRLRMAD